MQLRALGNGINMAVKFSCPFPRESGCLHGAGATNRTFPLFAQMAICQRASICVPRLK